MPRITSEYLGFVTKHTCKCNFSVFGKQQVERKTNKQLTPCAIHVNYECWVIFMFKRSNAKSLVDHVTRRYDAVRYI